MGERETGMVEAGKRGDRESFLQEKRQTQLWSLQAATGAKTEGAHDSFEGLMTTFYSCLLVS